MKNQAITLHPPYIVRYYSIPQYIAYPRKNSPLKTIPLASPLADRITKGGI